MKKYTFTWDRLTTWITVILSLVCLFLFYEGYRLFAYEEGSKGIGVFVIFMSAAILLVPIFFCPFYATKKEQTITIHFLAHRKILNLQRGRTTTSFLDERLASAVCFGWLLWLLGHLAQQKQ